MRAWADAAGDGLPSDVVAHRLGDFVFVYHGADLNAADPNLWVVVGVPAANTSARPTVTHVTWPATSTQPAITSAPPAFTAGSADGNVTEYNARAFQDALARQNALRQRANLPPLPNPMSVRQYAEREPP